MKITFVLLMLALFSCTRSPKSQAPDSISSPENPEFMMDMAPSTLQVELNNGLIDGLVSDNSTSIPFGDVLLNTKATKRITIYTKTALTNLDISGFRNAQEFKFKSSNCTSTLQAKRTCVIDMEFLPRSTPGLVSENITLGIAVFDLNANVINQAPPVSSAPQLSTLQNSLNLGDYFGIQVSARITVFNSSSGNLPVVITPAELSNPDFTYVSYCPELLRSLGSCQVEIYYNSALESSSDVNKTTSITIGSKSVPIAVKHKAALQTFPIVPVVESAQLVTLTEPQNFNSSIRFTNISTTDFSGPSQILSSHPGLVITSSNCSSGLRAKRTCTVYYTLKSSALPLGNTIQKIKLKNATLTSNSYSVPVKVNINLANTGSSSPVIVNPDTGSVQVTPEPPEPGSPEASYPTPPNITLPPDLNCDLGSSYYPDTQQCEVDYYSLYISYNDEFLGKTMKDMVVLRNGALCEDDCLDSVKYGDVIKIVTGSTGFTAVKDYTITGNRGAQSIKPNELMFTVIDDNVKVVINLTVGSSLDTEVPPTPTPVPAPTGGIASIRCYNSINALALLGSFKIQNNSEIPSYILSAPADPEVDTAIVDSNNNPKYHGFIRYEEEVLQCYNFSQEIPPLASTLSCEERLRRINFPNLSICTPKDESSTGGGSSGDGSTGGGSEPQPSVSIDLCSSLKICSASIPPDISEAFSKVSAWTKHATGVKTCTPSITCTLPKCSVKCKRWGCKVKCSGGGCTVKTCVSISDATSAINKVTQTMSNLERAINICSGSNNPCGNSFQVLQSVAQQIKDLYNANIGPLRISGVTGTRDLINGITSAYNTSMNTMANVSRESYQVAKTAHKLSVDGIAAVNGPTVGVLTNIHRETVGSIASIHDNTVNEVTSLHNNTVGEITQAHNYTVNKITEENQNFIDRLRTKTWEFIKTTGSFSVDVIEATSSMVATNIKNNYEGAKTALQKTLDTTVSTTKNFYNTSVDAFKDTLSTLVIGIKQGAQRVSELDYEGLKDYIVEMHDNVVAEMTRQSETLADASGIVYQQSINKIADYHQVAVSNIATMNSQSAGLIVDVSNGDNPFFNDLTNSNNLIMQSVGTVYNTATSNSVLDWNNFVQLSKTELAKAVQAVSNIKVRIAGDYNPFDGGGGGLKIPTKFFCSIGMCKEDGTVGIPGTESSSTLPPRSLTITYNVPSLASQLEVLIFKNGEQCSGSCLNNFRANDIVVIFIDSYGPIITDIKSNVVLQNYPMHNGLYFIFEDHDTNLNVFLMNNSNPINLTNTNWSSATLTTQTRACSIQPDYSIGGYESSTNNFQTFTPCSSFTCTSGSVYSSTTNTCNPVGCTVASANIQYATAVAGTIQTGCYPTSCSAGYKPSGNICAVKSCSDVMTTTELSLMGINPSNSSGILTGTTYPYCTLASDACTSAYYLASSAKSCELRTTITLTRSSVDYFTVDTTSSGVSATGSGQALSNGSNSSLPIVLGGVSATDASTSASGTGATSIVPTSFSVLDASSSNLLISGQTNKPISSCDLDNILASPCEISGNSFSQSFSKSELAELSSLTFIINELTTTISISKQKIKQVSNLVSGGDDITSFFPARLVAHNNELYFQGRTPILSTKLFKITNQGEIIQVSNTRESNTNATKTDDIAHLTSFEGYLYMSGANVQILNKLMRMDAGGNIYQISNLTGSDKNDYPYSIMPFNSELYFGALVDGSNNKLFKISNNTIYQVSNIRGNGFNDGVANLTPVGSNLYFSAQVNNNIHKIFKLDINGNITQVSNMRGSSSDLPGPANSSAPSVFANINGELYFPGFNASGQTKLFKLSTSTGAITQVSNIRSGADGPTSLRVLNNELYFVANIGATTGVTKLHKVNPNGTITQISNLRNGATDGITSHVVYNNELYFSGLNSAGFTKLYKVNSQGAITQVMDLRPGQNDLPPSGATSPMNMIIVNNELYFTAYNSAGYIKIFKLSSNP